ncbi:hypothetical protein [Bradyrhizobium elkanii]|uniref:hypothetical protein n=1 Tax=Bradyrhizobium elkanii TaxID=29448 RepID=UPI0021671919|nr:hypothetical protein [Bradyrhizobium elkanii]MCS3519237.1 hypothetical protein [Bradyrhizobium elkanii]MCS4066895.1 hypothetical protein [Bradyrhizobium elkanii]MCS4082430.1 hypothetical protein [Bradyrhizobium elkanii]MCW2127956.1 hypothetical protein [Bradyrhizobium elkanii]MCW2174697.1 hypothetical protein [Bradyrhizobium elkanii]
MAERNDEAVSEGGPGRPNNLSEWFDPWLGKLIEDPNKIPNVMLLCGYTTNSPDEKAVRVFCDPQLLWCIDVPKDAILHREGYSTSTSPLGGSYLWIDRAAWWSCRTYRRQC